MTPKPPAYVDLTVVHASLKWSASGETIATYVRDLINEHRPHVVGLTEFQFDNEGVVETAVQKMTILREHLPKGFVARRRGEFVQVYDSRVVRKTLEAPTLHRLSHVHEGRDEWRDMRAALFPLRVPAIGARLDWWDFHAPSGIESGVHIRRGLQWDAWHKGMKELGKKIDRRPEAHHQIAGGDTNGNQRHGDWERRIQNRTGLESTWTRDKPGTHPRNRPGRCIDALLVEDGLRTSPAKRSTVKPPAPIDHWAVVVERVRVPAPRVGGMR